MNLTVHAIINVNYYHFGYPGPADCLTPTPVDQTNWWITSFSPRIQNVQMDKLKVQMRVNFTNANLWTPFYARWQTAGASKGLTFPGSTNVYDINY